MVEISRIAQIVQLYHFACYYLFVYFFYDVIFSMEEIKNINQSINQSILLNHDSLLTNAQALYKSFHHFNSHIHLITTHVHVQCI